VVGFAMRMMNVPIVPCLLGLILGPMLEYQLRRSLMANLGDPTIFLTRPISLGLLLIAAAVIIVPVVMRARRPAEPVAAT
jgi:putative tricarboxylic transport membrane protein